MRELLWRSWLRWPPVSVAGGEPIDRNFREQGLEPTGAKIHTGLFGDHAAEHDQPFLAASGHRVLDIFNRLPLARFTGDDDVALGKKFHGCGKRRDTGQKSDAAHLGLRIAHGANSGANVELVCKIIGEGGDRDGGYVVA